MSWQSSSIDSSFNHSTVSAATIETPISPPHYDRTANLNQGRVTREYVDQSADEWSGAGGSLGSGDVDHRQLRIPGLGMMGAISKEKLRSLDVDHRNLISLTASPTGIAPSSSEAPQHGSDTTWMQEVRIPQF